MKLRICLAFFLVVILYIKVYACRVSSRYHPRSPLPPPCIDGHCIRIASCNVRGIPIVNDQGYDDRLTAFTVHCRDTQDVILIQELFSSHSRRVVETVLADWNVVTVPAAGLCIAHRHTLTTGPRYLEFAQCRGVDCFVSKGALSVDVVGWFRIVNTHLQDRAWDAAGSIRNSQLTEISQWVNDGGVLPVIVAGDFNTDISLDPLANKLHTMGRVSSGGCHTHPGSKEELDYAVVMRGELNLRASCSKLVADHRAIFFTVYAT